MTALAAEYLHRLHGEPGISPAFTTCLAAMDAHLDEGKRRVGRLG